jgi:imidazole glycerol-phosphate synthase subunit HisH
VIVIIDYGMGNLGSVMNMLKKIGACACISADAETIARADKFILPGVGSYDMGMQNLSSRGLVDILNEEVLNRQKPILGICLGAQLLTCRSEEGALPGLGWIEAETVRFSFPDGENQLKIPHMGWNEIAITRDNSLLRGFEEAPRFYFVHSYYLRCNLAADVIAAATHGIEFAAAVNHHNIWGTQFHPEKSHKFGLKVLKNFNDL